MYQFIQNINEVCKISLSDIQYIENKFDLEFPEELCNFYLMYNGADTKLCEYKTQSSVYPIHEFYSIKYVSYPTKSTLEMIIEWDRMDGFIPIHMIPFGEDQGGDRYYYNSLNGEIVLFPCEDIDNPVIIANNLSQFLDGMKNTERTAI